jgi:energy-coupling factor transport system substrate-specific component
MLIGSQWSVDTLVSGFVQGAAAELVFAAYRYRNWSLPAIAVASLASVAAAFVHDWLVYYATYDAGALTALAGFMAFSGLVVLPLVAIAIVSALRQTGVLEGFPA